MLPLLLFNVISSLVIDKATDLATEHVESMIDDLLPEAAKKDEDLDPVKGSKTLTKKTQEKVTINPMEKDTLRSRR